MTGEIEVLEALESRARRREDRRAFFRAVGTAAKAAGGIGAATLSAGAYAATTAPSDTDILNFALNLEYLEAQFYSYAVTGAGLNGGLLTGNGTQGTVKIETGTKAVPFKDPVVKAFARELANDELLHVNYLRSVLGSLVVAMPAIDISAAGAFASAARASGLAPFNPYADDQTFLLGAYLFEDVGVTAYKGAAALLSNATYVSAAAGILATEAYHASIIRTTLTSKGVTMPALLSSADAISKERETLDGTGDDDVGLTGTASATSVVPADGNGLIFGRDTGQVLNIVYLTQAQTTMGGFFPKGVNGAITMSSAN